MASESETPSSVSPQDSSDTHNQEQKQQNQLHMHSLLPRYVLLSRMRAVLYGNCIGDAIGLLTEFMTKEEAREVN